MSGRRISVDLGPLSLVLCDGVGPSFPSNGSACGDDVLRLQSLMRAGRDAPGINAPGVSERDDEGGHASEGLISAARLGTQGASGMPTLDDAHVELLAFELSAALQARQAIPVDASEKVRLALRPAVLRDAELGVTDCDGTLEFSLWVGNDDDCQWLALQLPRLACAMGDRLRRPMRMRVFEAGRQQLMLAEASWPPEVDA